MFPHKFSTKFETLRQFKVIIKQEPLERIHLYVKLSSKEVGWLMIVTRDGDVYTVHETFVPKQAVSMTETDMSADGLTELAEELILLGRADDVEHIRGWGHSHVNMGTSPSGTDNTTMAEFAKETQWMLRIIANKDGKIECTIVDMLEGILVSDVPWQTDAFPLTLEAEVKRELEEKVSERTFQQRYQGNQGVGFAGSNGDVKDGSARVTTFHKDGTKTVEIIHGNGSKQGYIEPCKHCSKYYCQCKPLLSEKLSDEEIKKLDPQDLADYYSMMEY